VGTERCVGLRLVNISAPRAEIEIGHLSTRLCHLGNIAFRLGRKLTFDGSREAFHDPEANRMLARESGSRFEMPSQV
jgi:Oxidoreductase family, C-terminal alpha/beta domain